MRAARRCIPVGSAPPSEEMSILVCRRCGEVRLGRDSGPRAACGAFAMALADHIADVLEALAPAVILATCIALRAAGATGKGQPPGYHPVKESCLHQPCGPNST